MKTISSRAKFGILWPTRPHRLFSRFRWYQFSLLALSLPFCSLTRGEEIITPHATTVDRYKVIWTRAPFTAASVTEDDKSSGTWVLTGLAGSSGDPILFVENKESQERVTVTKEKNEKDFQILSFNPQADLFQSTAKLRIAGQEVNVQFDKTLIASNAPPATNIPQPLQNFGGFPPNRLPNPGQFSIPMNNGMHPVHRVMIPAPPNGTFPTFPQGQPLSPPPTQVPPVPAPPSK